MRFHAKVMAQSTAQILATTDMTAASLQHAARTSTARSLSFKKGFSTRTLSEFGREPRITPVSPFADPGMSPCLRDWTNNFRALFTQRNLTICLLEPLV